MVIHYGEIEPIDHLDFKNNSYIKYMMQVNKEKFFFNCMLKKYNRFGMQQNRVLLITDRNIYSLSPKGKTAFTIQRKILLKDVDAITLSDPVIESDEILIHVTNEYDYRYNAQEYKNDIIKSLRSLINKQVEHKIRKKQCRTYLVDRKALKIYATLKTEQEQGIFRRPEDIYLWDDKVFIDRESIIGSSELTGNLERIRNGNKAVLNMIGKHMTDMVRTNIL